MDKARTHTQTGLQIECNGVVYDGLDASRIADLDDQTMAWFGLRRGDVFAFDIVETATTAERVREWKHGFNGQKRDIATRVHKLVHTGKQRKLWHTKARGWYWLLRVGKEWKRIE